MPRILYKFLFLLLTPCCFFSQNVKGFYVDAFNNILGNPAREDSLLLFAKNNGFNYLTLYNVHLVHAATPLTNTNSAQGFAAFIQKAKSQYNIVEIGVAAENFDFFNTVIQVYNQQHGQSVQQVDVYNLEFEFWVPGSVSVGSYYCNTYLQPAAYSCDTAGAFAFYKKTLRRIDSLANSISKKSEAYFGFFNTGQGKQIVQSGVDRVLISIYIPSVNYSAAYQYNYAKTRLSYLGGANTNIKVITLYSAEPSFMQTWVTSNPYFQPYSDFAGSLSAETAGWKNFIQQEGIQWFAYSFMPRKNMTVGIQEVNEVAAIDLILDEKARQIFIFPPGMAQYELLDVTGCVVQKGNVSTGSIDVINCSSGIYFVKLQSADGYCLMKKISLY